MSLSPGRRLGNYEVLGPLGAGGMGEVYEARDLRLGRVVAALDHPHIVTLHVVAAAHVAVDPAYDPIRGDPRFTDLLRRLGLPIEGS